jgi:hypothetical protein
MTHRPQTNPLDFKLIINEVFPARNRRKLRNKNEVVRLQMMSVHLNCATSLHFTSLHCCLRQKGVSSVTGIEDAPETEVISQHLNVLWTVHFYYILIITN